MEMVYINTSQVPNLMPRSNMKWYNKLIRIVLFYLFAFLYFSCGSFNPFALYIYMMELGEEPAITDLVRKTHMKSDGTFVDKRAQRIIEEVESIVVSEHPSTDETDSQGSNSEASITPVMRD